jgi:NADH-quinone oxidoreductase subunit H
VTDVWGLILGFVHWVGTSTDRAIDGLGLEGGWVDRIAGWLTDDADVYVASIIAFIALVLWTVPWVLVASVIDRRMRARMEGRSGPTYMGAWGILQELTDMVKLKLRWREDMPSAALPAFSLALVLGALAILPLGPWSRLADPSWGMVLAPSLLVLSMLPTAMAARGGQRVHELAEATGTGIVLVLAVASPLIIIGSGRADDVIAFQNDAGWGVLLAPLGFTLFLMAMYWESVRFARARRTGPSREGWPGPHMTMDRVVIAARYFALGVLGSLVFLGGWTGLGPDGHWWTLLKAILLMVVVSLVAGALPLARPGETAHDVRRRWFPLAAINLVLVAGILEVMA